MAKIDLEKFEKIQELFDSEGGMLFLSHELSPYSGDIYSIKLKPNQLIDTEHHPINLSKHCIEMIKSIVGEGVDFNNTRTTFWIL